MSTFRIDGNTIHYTPDEDLPEQVEHIPIAEVLEFFTWFRRREGVLRKLVSERDPIPVFKPMMRLGEYYVGVCGEGTYHRAKVKVKVSRWDEIMQQTANVVRSNWLYDLRQADLPATADIEYYDASGNLLPGPQDAKGNTILNLKSDRATLTENDCPDYLIQQELAKIAKPEFWVMRDDNLDRGKFAKLP